MKQNSLVSELVDHILGNMFKFPNPGRWGWITVLLVLVIAYWSVITSATSQEETFRLLSLLSFTSSIVLAEPRIKWPTTLQKPLSLGMFFSGTGLMFFWILAFGLHPSFNLMALLFAFAVTMREMRKFL